jgi:hypothetical protein
MSRRTRTVWIRSEWAFVFQTHRAPLLETCGFCFREDPLVITKPPARDNSLQLAFCWNFLENAGTLEVAQRFAGHPDSRTTKLYDRRGAEKAICSSLPKAGNW